MPDFQSLDELEAYIRKTLPESRKIQKLQQNAESKFIDFHWHQRHFAVRPNLDVLEIKDGKRLMITGASRLIQSCLTIKDRNIGTLKAVIEIMQQAEEMLRTKSDQGLAMVGSVKATLKRMIQK